MHHICSQTLAKAGERKATAWPNAAWTGIFEPCKKKRRLAFDEKVGVLEMLDRKWAQEKLADSFECSVRPVRQINSDPGEGPGAPTAGTYNKKISRRGGFPEVRRAIRWKHSSFVYFSLTRGFEPLGLGLGLAGGIFFSLQQSDYFEAFISSAYISFQ